MINLYRGQTDETLVMLSLAGEMRAYEMLVEKYERTVIAAAFSVTHSRFMAEDAAQDAFVTAWMKLNLLREGEKFGAWVCRIAKNCAKNTVMRYQSYLSLDEVGESLLSGDFEADPARLTADTEQRDLLHKSVSRLPEKVSEIIRLYYFEDLSIAEIARRLHLAEGTVKWQLNNGRKKLRKELCAMNEEMNDAFVRRVMKKVEELKSWQYKNCKDGFADVYKDVLRDVGELPESEKKYHAKADVLLRGWWWLPGAPNDALFAEIKDAALRGHNDDVMRFISIREHQKMWGDGRQKFIKEVQIPKLKEDGFVKALGSAYFWLACGYLNDKKWDEARENLTEAVSVLPKNDLYHAAATGWLTQMEKLSSDFADVHEKKYNIYAGSAECRIANGRLRRYVEEGTRFGTLYSVDLDADRVLRNASRCDGYFTDPSLTVGETFTGSDGSTLTYEADGVSVSTPAGTFDGCALWTVRHEDTVYKTYYKDGVGIVRQEKRCDGITETRTLCSYKIVGGTGLIPCAEGNTWQYTGGYDESILTQSSTVTVHFADEDTCIFADASHLHRHRYDENSWLDTISEIRNEYFDGEHVCDVSAAIERAFALAETPMQKAHTKAAASVAKRIMDTNPEFNPDCTETGHWNFFARRKAHRKGGKIRLNSNFRYSFELKNTDGTPSCDALLYNNLWDLLRFSADCVWSDEWQAGKTVTEEFLLWDGEPIKTNILCEDGGSVVTKAGTFENCLKITMESEGFEDGHNYFGVNKEFYFAEGVGIVRTVNHVCDGAADAVYELTSYEGIGEGYMPLADGLVRRYDGIGFFDGYVGWMEYTYVADEDGTVVIFEDRAGVRKKPEKMREYTTYGESLEEPLFDAGNYKGAHLRYAVNLYHEMLHMLTRPSWNRTNHARSAGLNGFKMQTIESFGDTVPPAWEGIYSRIALIRAAALFSYGQREEAYRCLDLAFEYCEKWTARKMGEELDTGKVELFGGVKLVKGKDVIILPDGTKEPTADTHTWWGADNIYHAMTAKKGWEWFVSEREQPRYQTYVERAREMMEKK